MTKSQIKSTAAEIREAIRLAQLVINAGCFSAVHGAIDRLENPLSRAYGTDNEALSDLAIDARKTVKELHAMLDEFRPLAPAHLVALATVSTAVIH